MTKDVSVYRDCKHGQLKRSCELCANEQEIAGLHSEVVELQTRLATAIQHRDGFRKQLEELRHEMDGLESEYSDLQKKMQDQSLQIISLIGQEQEKHFCPYCESDNEGVLSAYFDQTCAGCVKRMTAPKQEPDDSDINEVHEGSVEQAEPAAYFQLVRFGNSLIHEQVVIQSKEDVDVFPLYTAPQGQTELLRKALEAMESVQNAEDYDEDIYSFHKTLAAVKAIKQHLGEV